MKTVPIHEAKTHLSRLIDQACAGEEIVIRRRGESVVKLVPVQRNPPGRRFGALKGRLVVDASFFEPLPEDELERWG